MLNIFSCVFWPFGLLHLKTFCSGHLPISSLGFGEFRYLSSLYIIVTNPLSHV
jgi:hypothetical protein